MSQGLPSKVFSIAGHSLFACFSFLFLYVHFADELAHVSSEKLSVRERADELPAIPLE
jgi:hypothetical protein